MKKVAPITALFLDIGGVLLNDGWSYQSREMAAMVFNLDLAEINHRHQLTVETYEMGKLTLEEYLSLVIFLPGAIILTDRVPKIHVRTVKTAPSYDRAYPQTQNTVRTQDLRGQQRRARIE